MTQGTPMTTLFPGAPLVPGLLAAAQPAAGESVSPFASLFAQLTDPATGAPISIHPEIAYAPLPPAAIPPKNADSPVAQTDSPVAQTAKEMPETQTEPETTMSNSPLWMATAGAVLTSAPPAPIRLPESEETDLHAAPVTEITVERSAPSSNAFAVPPVVSPYPGQTDAARSQEERLLSGRLESSPPRPAEPDVPVPARGTSPPMEKPPPEPDAPQPIPNRSMQALEVDAVSKTIGEPKAPLSFPIETPEGSAPVTPSAKTGATPSAPSDAEAEHALANPAPAAEAAMSAPSVSPEAAAKPVRSPTLAAEPVRPAQTPPAALVSRPDDSAVVSAPESSRESGATHQKEPVVMMTTSRPAEVNDKQTAAQQSADSPTASRQTSQAPAAPRREPRSVPESSLPEAGTAPLRETPVHGAVPVVRKTAKPDTVAVSLAAAPTIMVGTPVATAPTAAIETLPMSALPVSAPPVSAPPVSAPPVSAPPMSAPLSETSQRPSVLRSRGSLQAAPAEAPALPVTAYTLAAASPETVYLSGKPLSVQKAVPLLDSVQKEAVLSTPSILTVVKAAVTMPEASVTDPGSSLPSAAMPATGGDTPTPMAATASTRERAEPHTPAVSGAFAVLQSVAPAEPEAIPTTEITPPERMETASTAAIRLPKSSLFETQPPLQTQLSLSVVQRENAVGTGAGQPDPDSPSGGETGLSSLRGQAAVRTANAAMVATSEPETVSENRHPSAKTETMASTATSAAERVTSAAERVTSAAERPSPLIARSETVSEEAVVVQTRGAVQRTAAEGLFQRETTEENGDRSEPVRASASVAVDPESADAGGDRKAAVTSAAASVHASRTAQSERAERPAIGQQDRVRVVQQVLQKLETMRLTQGRQEITLHLKPENLGHLQVTIVTDRENVFARIVAETSQVRQAVEMGRDALREALEQRGLTLQHLDVSSQQGHGGGRQMPFVPEPFASSVRPYRMPGLSETGEIEPPHPSGVMPSRLAGRLDYVA